MRFTFLKKPYNEANLNVYIYVFRANLQDLKFDFIINFPTLDIRGKYDLIFRLFGLSLKGKGDLIAQFRKISNSSKACSPNYDTF